MAIFDEIIARDKHRTFADGTENWLGYTGNPPYNEAEYEAMNSMWKDPSKKSSWDVISAEMAAEEVRVNRRKEYPDWQEQLNKIYDDGIDKWKSEMVDPVKTKWPKDNSGPV